MKTRFKVIIGISIGVFALALAASIPLLVLGIRSATLESEWSYLQTDSTYSKKAEITGLSLKKQTVSCGYASIEMISSFYGERVSEEELDKKNNGAVSTASTSGFLLEINQSIEGKEFKQMTYMHNDEFLKEIHITLSKGDPVAIEWAAQYEGEWTLHFSVISAIDLGNDLVTVYNPYGYIEELDIASFLNRTSFKAYERMPLFLQYGFAFGAFDKNALFHVV